MLCWMKKIKIFHKNQNTDTYVDVMKQMAVTMQKDGHFIVLSAKEETICNAYRLHVVDDCTYLIAFTSENELKNEDGMFSESVEQLIDFTFNVNISGIFEDVLTGEKFDLSQGVPVSANNARVFRKI